MRISDILRTMADAVDQAEGGEQALQAEPTQIAPAPPEAVAQQPMQEPSAIPAMQGELEAPAEETPCGELDAGEVTMVSPLQQEHELLKKSQGVNNNVSEFAGDEQSDDDYDSELASMKQAAGIGEEPQGPHNYAEDIKPVSINPRAVAATEANGKQDPRLKQTQRRNR